MAARWRAALIAAALVGGLGVALVLPFTQPARAGSDLYLVLGDLACNRAAIASTAGCWSLFSGGAGGAGVPGPTDNAFLDVNSGAFTGDIDAFLDVHDWNATGFTGTIAETSGILRVENDFVNGGTFQHLVAGTLWVGGNFTATSGTFDGSANCIGTLAPTPVATVEVGFGGWNITVDAPTSHASFCYVANAPTGVNVTLESDLKAGTLEGTLPGHWNYGYHNLTVGTFLPNVNDTLFGVSLGSATFTYTASGTNGGYLTIANFTQYGPRSHVQYVEWRMNSVQHPTTASLQFQFNDLQPNQYYILCAVVHNSYPLTVYALSHSTLSSGAGVITFQVDAGTPTWPSWGGDFDMAVDLFGCPSVTPPSVTSGAWAGLHSGFTLVDSVSTLPATEITGRGATLRGTSTLALTYSAQINGNHITSMAGFSAVIPGVAWEGCMGCAAVGADTVTYTNGTQITGPVNSTIYYNANISLLPACTTIFYYAFVISFNGTFAEGQSPLQSFSTPCNGQPTAHFWFEWSADPSNLTNRTANTTTNGGAFAQVISGLSPNTTWYYRGCVDSGRSVLGAPSPACGIILSFATGAVPPDPSSASFAQAIDAFWILLFLGVCACIVVGAYLVRDRI